MSSRASRLASIREKLKAQRRSDLHERHDTAFMLLIDAHEALETVTARTKSLPLAVRCGEVAGRIARFLAEGRRPT